LKLNKSIFGCSFNDFWTEKPIGSILFNEPPRVFQRLIVLKYAAGAGSSKTKLLRSSAYAGGILPIVFRVPRLRRFTSHLLLDAFDTRLFDHEAELMSLPV
jgi:hypothetical protein